jgi:hypothetical protein
MTQDSIYRILAQLDAWRDLPSFKLESRVDMLFGLFLPNILRKSLGIAIDRMVFPEFPLRQGTLSEFLDNGDPRKEKWEDSNRSVKIDFMVLSQDHRIAFLVEIKTDQRSVNKGQVSYLQAAKRAGVGELVAGVFKIARKANANSRRKYAHLFHLLETVGCVESTQPSNVAGEISSLQAATRLPPEIRIVYITPGGLEETDEELFKGIGSINFEEVSQILVEVADPIGQVLAKYLRKWKMHSAGSRDPRTTADS